MQFFFVALSHLPLELCIHDILQLGALQPNNILHAFSHLPFGSDNKVALMPLSLISKEQIYSFDLDPS